VDVVALGVRLLSAMKCDPPVSRLPSPNDRSAEVFDCTVRADTVRRWWVSRFPLFAPHPSSPLHFPCTHSNTQDRPPCRHLHLGQQQPCFHDALPPSLSGSPLGLDLFVPAHAGPILVGPSLYDLGFDDLDFFDSCPASAAKACTFSGLPGLGHENISFF